MDRDCAEVLSLLPDWERAGLTAADYEAVEGHLRTCDACRAEAELVVSLRASRPEPPAGLEVRITAALDHELAAFGRPARRRRPTWMLAAAAVVVALGTGVVWNQMRTETAGVSAAAMEPVPDSWLIDDAVVAGAPVLEDLSEEDLTTLLEEFGG